jgi:hypothetical protein
MGQIQWIYLTLITFVPGEKKMMLLFRSQVLKLLEWIVTPSLVVPKRLPVLSNRPLNLFSVMIDNLEE